MQPARFRQVEFFIDWNWQCQVHMSSCEFGEESRCLSRTVTGNCASVSLERSFPPAEVEYRWHQFWSKVMTSEVEQRPTLVEGGFRWHRSQWVKGPKLAKPTMRMILSVWFEHLSENVSFILLGSSVQNVFPICKNQFASCWKSFMQSMH